MKPFTVKPILNSDDDEAALNAPRSLLPPAFAEALGASPLHLLHRLLQIAIDIYNAEVGETAITQRQFAVLRVLEEKDGISQSQLCRAAGIDRSTMAELVARMARKGLLRRERSPTDARVNVIWLDAGGREALHSLLPHVEAANTKIRVLLSRPEYAGLTEFLRRALPGGAEATPTDLVPAAKPLKTSKKAKKDKRAKWPEKLPMPPLSEGAVPDASDDKDEAAKKGKWKPPKPIWNI